MPVVLQVTWAEKIDHPDPHQRIRQIGGSSGSLVWTHTCAQAIESIEQNLFAYYVEKDARKWNLEVGLSPGGGKFLKARAGDSPPELLLNLPAPAAPVQA